MMNFKKNIISVAVAGVMFGVAGTASAALSLAPQGTGNILLVPYFSTQNGNKTLLNITNTDTVKGKAVKVRFRSAKDSDDIFDFQVFLSPGDVWTASIEQTAAGVSKLTSDDVSCTVPAKNAANIGINVASFQTGRLGGATDAEKNAQTLEGYVEIFNMADIPLPVAGIGPFTKNYAAMTDAEKAATLYGTVKHVSNVAPCSATILEGIEAKGAAATVAANDGKGWRNTGAANAGTVTGGVTNASLDQDEINAAAEIDIPTGGLMATWTLINVPNTTTYTGDAVAIRAGAVARNLYSKQTSDPVTATTGVTVIVPPAAAGEAAAIAASSDFPNISSTFDAVLHTVGFSTAEYDFPDLSTPYEVGTVMAGIQAYDLSNSIAATFLTNEYLLDTGLSAKTDWLVSMPTKRYLAAGRGNTATGVSAATTGIYASGTAFAAANLNDGPGNVNDVTYVAGDGTTTKQGAQGYFNRVTTYAADGRSSCVTVGGYSIRNREETVQNASTVTVSPATVTPVQLCGEVNILSLSGETTNTGAVRAAQVVSALSVPYSSGWATISLNPTTAVSGVLKTVGLPVIGYSFIKAVNPAVAAGVSGTFGGAWQHRF